MSVLVRDPDLEDPEASGGPRLKVVADGLPLFGRAQLAVDTTLVSVSALRRQFPRWCGPPGRSGVGCGRTSQGTDEPGVGGFVEPMLFGGHGQRCRWEMVTGSSIGEGEGTQRAAVDAASGTAGVEREVVGHHVVCSSPGRCRVHCWIFGVKEVQMALSPSLMRLRPTSDTRGSVRLPQPVF